MEVTLALIDKVRLLLGETDLQNSLFSDQEISGLLEDASSLEEALYMAWTLKATKVMFSSDNIASMSVGAESISFASPKDYADYCLAMAKIYKELLPVKFEGSRAFSLEPPTFEGIE